MSLQIKHALALRFQKNIKMTAKERISKTRRKLKTGKKKIGKYNIGFPGSDSWNDKTPKWVKITGESFIFVGAGMAIVLGTMATPPGWLVAVSGLAGLAGRYVAKCFSE